MIPLLFAPGATTITAAVMREETIPAGATGLVRTKVVEMDGVGGHYTFWIAKEAPYIIKLTMKGPQGGVLSWTIPPDWKRG